MKNPNTYSIMLASAQAIWNPTDGCWDVVVTQSDCIEGQLEFSQRVNKVKVRDCDEYVIADALLDANGISVKSLYDSIDNPIVGE